MYSETGIYSDQPTSAYTAYEHGRAHRIDLEDKARQRIGIEAQILSAEQLADLHNEAAVMRAEINALRDQSLERSKQTEMAFQARDKIETRRFRINTFISVIAAMTGAASTIIALWPK